jgi:hypothetical protein
MCTDGNVDFLRKKANLASRVPSESGGFDSTGIILIH